MITKEQALEFIHELYNQTTVYINLEKGKMYVDVYVDYEEGITGTYTADIGFKPQSNELPLLEELVTEFIKVNQDSNLFNNFDKIPVDVDMLEVGQTYKVFLSDKCTYGLSKLNKHTYLGEKDGYYMFERTEGNVFDLKQEDIEEIYKVNECID